MSNQENGWANPGPAGLVALAVACYAFGALYTGRVAGSSLPLLGIWLLGGFVIQITVAVIELREGTILGGNVFLFFSAFFMFVTGLECLFKFWMSTKGIALDTTIDGYAWVVLASSLLLWTPGYFKAPLVMGLLVLSLDVAVPIIALKDLKILGSTAAFIAGIFLFIAGTLAIYMAAGTILNSVFGKKVLPLGPPIIKPAK